MAACSRIPFAAGPFEAEIVDRLCGRAGPGMSTSARNTPAEPVDTDLPDPDLPDLDLATLDLPDFGRSGTPSTPRGRVVGRRRIPDAAGGDIATWRRAPLQVAAALLFARALDAVPGLAVALRTGTPRVIVEVTDPLLLGVLRGIWPVLLFGEHGISESIDRALTPREAERADILALVATELPKPRERDEVERSFLQVLQVPRPVLCLTVDAERALLPIVRQVADHSLVLPGLDPTLVAATIRIVTGRWGKRADRAALATLDTMPADLAIAVRADRTPAACLCDLRRLAAGRADRSGSGRDLRLADLHGMRPAVAWARETLDDLRAWRAGGPWSEVSSGALIVGPPGCGKTLLAAVMAAEEGLPFVTGSLARWQAEDQAHLGTTLRAMRRSFEEAITLARSGPGGRRGAILLIDEADSFPDRARVTHAHRDYVVEVVNAILELLSGAASREGVVVIGTTNDATRCDPALLRPGRLSRLIEVGYPDMDERVAMLRVRLRGDLPEADLAPVARLTERATGAVIEEVVADARRLAREAGRPLALADLLSVVNRAGAGRPPALLRRAAIHEAGHALVAALERGTEHLVVALQDRDGAAGWVDYANEPSQAGTRSEIEGMLRILLAGRAAEIEMLGEPSAGARGDLTAATNLAVAALGCWGLGSSTLVALEQDPAQRLLLDARLHGEVAVLLGAIAEEAADLVYRNGSAVMRIAEALLAERRLDGARVAELLHELGGIATGERIAARGAA